MSRRSRLLPATLAFALSVLLNLTGLRAEVPDGWAEPGSHSMLACDDITSAGVIAGSAKGCANPLFQPARITNVTYPSGGSGALEYLWMMTTQNPGSNQPVSWQIIPNTPEAEYTPGPLSQTTYFTRCARRAGCSKWSRESNYVTIIIDCCENVTSGGTIGGAQSNCGIPYDPSLLNNISPATGGANGLSYTWYQSTTSQVYVPGSPAWTVAGSVTTPYFNPGPVTESTHYVRVARRALCTEPGAWSNVISVNAFRRPEIKADVTDVTCAGATDGTVAVTIINAAPPFTYRWMDSGITATTRSNLAAGIYQFEIIDGNGCTVIEQVEIRAPSPLLATATASFNRCNFANDASLVSTVSGGIAPYTYVWSSGETTANISGKSAGNYTLTITDAKGCSVTATALVNPPTTLAASLSKNDPLCYQPNGSITVNLTGGSAPFTYAWTPNISTSASANNLAGGTYSVMVEDANGCTVSVSTTLDVTPDINVVLDADAVTCNGGSNAAIRSTSTGGTLPYSYSWNTGATTKGLSGVGPGTYTLIVTDARGCDKTATITLLEPTALSASISVTQPICQEDGGTLLANIIGGTTPYTWNWGTAGQNNVQTLNTQPAGTYTLNVTDAAGCTFTTTANVEATTLLTLLASKTDASCPSENDGSATLSISGGQAPLTIRWSDASSQSTATATALLAGNYTATVTDARGCIKTAAVTIDTRSTGPVVVADLDSLDCLGGTEAAIRLSVTGGISPYTYAWSDGPTSKDRSNLAAGTYEVLITDAAGCENRQTFSFTAPQPITCKVSPSTVNVREVFNFFHVSAFGATDGQANATIAGGSAPYLYSWSNGGTAASASGLRGGNVSLTITDAKGCTCTHDTLLIEPSQISDFVWEDLNGDGIQNVGEPGLQGIGITLNGRDFANRVINRSATSGSNGQYMFNDLPMGQYTIRFRLQPSQDYLLSPANQGGDDTKDSDMDPVLSLARDTIKAHGVANRDLDAGFIPRTSVISIGNKVWYDANHDGIQDQFELEVQGVTMNLFRKADNALVNTVVTNEDGEYYFLDVVPGTYFITADLSTSTNGSYFDITAMDRGADDSRDSDFDPLTGRSGDIVVTAATQDITNIDLGLHEACPTLATAGIISGDEDVCVGSMPAPINSVSVPVGAVRYQWYRSASNTYRGSNDPQWTRINGATSASYQPSVIATTVYYIRLATEASCGADYTGASNVIVKRAIASPIASLASANSSDGGTNSGKQITMCQNATLTVTADSLSPATFSWDFGPDATPRTALGSVIRNISFGTGGARKIYLSVANAQGCVGRDSFLVNTIACVGPGQIGGVDALTSGGSNQISWSAISLMSGSYFKIERALGDGAFETIETVQAKSIGDWQEYDYVDRFAPSGKTSYRIMHQAPETPTAQSNIVQLQVEQVAIRTKVYPNPASSNITLEVAAAEMGPIRYSLHNAFGATLRQGEVSAGATNIGLDDLSAGTYYLHIITQSGQTEVRPIVRR